MWFSHADKRISGTESQVPVRTSCLNVQYMLGHLGTYEEEEKVIGWIIRAAVELNKEGEMREV